VGLLNLAYGVVEVAVSLSIGSVSLAADAADFVEDAAINLLIFFAVLWSARRRAIVGRGLAFIVLVPAVAALATAVTKILDPSRPETISLTITAAGALAVNLACAAILVRHRHHSGSLAQAAWLAARNDALANVAILGAAAVALAWASGWPDIIVGLGIAAINADAAAKVWRTAKREGLGAPSAEA
jgi:Co/Zn/Cd efflux system component